MKERISNVQVQGMVPGALKAGLLVVIFQALACGPVDKRASGAKDEAAAQAVGAASPSKGEAGLWDFSTALHDATPTRESVSMEGLWRWQPAEAGANTVPADGWGRLRVPEQWPRQAGSAASKTFSTHPSWESVRLDTIDAAWYQVEIPIPGKWADRRIAIDAEFVNSFASVYVNGQKAGDIRFPGGEVDLTPLCRPGQTHKVSMLVLAMPLKAVILSFGDSDAAKQMRGSVGKRGLCGDVRLTATPKGGAIGHVKIETSVRQWQIKFAAPIKDIDPQATYALRARIFDNGDSVAEFTGPSVRGGDLKDGRMSFTADWRPKKLWDIHTPQNTYDASLFLLDGKGAILDEALPDRFGFRELWIDGRDFRLNGSRVFLSFTRAQPGWSYEGSRKALEDLRKVGINFVAAGGFGCLPGEHQSFKEVLRATDDAGTLLALTQPHIGHYDWSAPDADEKNGYAFHAEFYTRVAGNHPSVVFYATSHNACGYTEDMNPDMIDGLVDRKKWSRGSNAPNALRAETIVKRFDDSRVLYHHAGGNLGTMHTSNFYANWAPIQEMSDWFEHWATVGVKPMHPNEYGVPYPWDWAMYRGWYNKKRVYGSAVVPWEFCLAEWNAQLYGDKAYQISGREEANLRWEAALLRKGDLWHRWDYPYEMNSAFPEREGVYSMYFTDNWRAFRTWGLSVNDPSDFVRQAPKALLRNNMPLLAYIGGKPAAFTTKDHNLLPGEGFQKQLIIINNSREKVTAECRWSLGLPRPVGGERTIKLPTGEQERVPLTFRLPEDLAPGRYELTATVRFATGETQEDSFFIDVLSKPGQVNLTGRVALFDPAGETASMLRSMGAGFDPVGADANLADYDILIVGKGGLSVEGPAPDIHRVRDGLKVIIFEQTGKVLEKRLGFRVTEYGLRNVFRRVSGHAVLSGLSDEHLWNWRGEATLLPPRLKYDPSQEPSSEWCGMRVPQVWRCGNRGNVASALIEKPAGGDFLTILDGGYALQYATLMEHREGRGLILFCQVDVTGRSESDPAADTLARNILNYVSAWKAKPQSKVMYVGGPEGLAHVRAAGFEVEEFSADALSPDHVLLATPGSGAQLDASRKAVSEWYGRGGRVLSVGMEKGEISKFFPNWVAVRMREHISSYFEPPAADSPFAGIGPADIHNRDPRFIPMTVEGVSFIGGGLLSRSNDGQTVFCQLAPWQFDTKQQNTRRTFRNAVRVLTRTMCNMGMAGKTALLDNFSKPLGTSVDPIAKFVGVLRVESGDQAVALTETWKGLPLASAKEPKGWTEAAFDDAGWRDIRVPGTWETQFKELENFDGVFLYRTKVIVPAEFPLKDAFLALGAVDDEDHTYVNGALVGSITKATNPDDYYSAPRRYRLPEGALKTGENIIAVKVVDLRQIGGILGFTTTPDPRSGETKGEKRWLSGLYLDKPEAWDYPYRFFRW